MSRLTIEVDTPKDANLFFAPLGVRVRGRFDAQRRTARNPDNSSLLGAWPKPVPGQRVTIDAEAARLTIEEPLEDPSNADLAALFKKRGIEVPKTKTYDSVHVPSCLHQIKRAVDAGLAKVVEGKMPDKIDGAMLKSFITPDSEDPEETMRKALVASTRIMAASLDAIEHLAEAVAKLAGSGKDRK